MLLEYLTKPVFVWCGYGKAVGYRRVMGGGSAVAANGSATSERRAAAGSGPRRPDRYSVRVAQRHSVGDVAGRTGLRLGYDLLAPAARLARGGRVAAAAPGLARPARRGRAAGLVARQPGRAKHPGGKRGACTGPNPTDRGKPGTKRHLLVERRGTPLAVQLSAANRHDSTVFDALLDAVQPVRQARGRPRKRPAKLHAGKGYDYPKCRWALRQRGIQNRIARRSSRASGWDATAGWSSAPLLGSTASAACGYATNGAKTSTWPSPCSDVPSLLGRPLTGFVRYS